jgi:hypothetical protein
MAISNTIVASYAIVQTGPQNYNLSFPSLLNRDVRKPESRFGIGFIKTEPNRTDSKNG